MQKLTGLRLFYRGIDTSFTHMSRGCNRYADTMAPYRMMP